MGSEPVEAVGSLERRFTCPLLLRKGLVVNAFEVAGMQRSKLILIGGTSHVGKSTLGRRLAGDLGWNYLSTDQLARHPGRPWRAGTQRVPADVVEHYTDQSVTGLVDSVLSHYRKIVWPMIDAIVQARLNNPFDPGLVFEGSAILPELVSSGGYPRVCAVWLTAPDALIEERIKFSSGYAESTEAERRLIAAFLGRTMAIDRVLRTSVAATSQQLIDAGLEDCHQLVRSLV